MSIHSFNKVILIAALVAASTLARSDGIYPGGLGFQDGINNVAAAAPPATPCSGTGLIFSTACNSQYIGIL